MQEITIDTITNWTGGKLVDPGLNTPILHLLTDSRSVSHTENTLFVALKGERFNGHDFIENLAAKGVRNFLVNRSEPIQQVEHCNYIEVDDTFTALQAIGAAKRQSTQIPIIAITGSNGKTTVKEWLSTFLATQFNVVKNPKSFNSQIGVPLSLWRLQSQHTIGVFEAGISEPSEMVKLANMLQPSHVIFTNLGPAHDEGFASREEKLQEKLRLLQSAEVVVYSAAHKNIAEAIAAAAPTIKHVAWDFADENLTIGKKTYPLKLPFTNPIWVENCCHALTMAFEQGLAIETLLPIAQQLQPVEMRLQMVDGKNNMRIVNDAYNNDLAALQVALDYTAQQKGSRPMSAIVTDIKQSGLPVSEWRSQMSALLKTHQLDTLITVGEHLKEDPSQLVVAKKHHHFANTQQLIDQVNEIDLGGHVVLVKGSRAFGLEKVVALMEQQNHETVWEINLTALANNLNYFKSKLTPKTKVMAMVKALAYGIGEEQIANVLQHSHIDYLGVAYTDEGVALRKAGIDKPIMVMNANEAAFETLYQYQLEPEIYSISQLKAFTEQLAAQGISDYPIHIKIETGMHRLGFEIEELPALIEALQATKTVHVTGILSHLAAADNESHKTFTEEQIALFTKGATQLEDGLGYTAIKHICNSAGIVAYPNAHFDMVRLGIGLYGIMPTGETALGLQQIGTLRSFISQIKEMKTGHSVGYNRSFIAKQDMRIAVLPIGYADGFDRRLSNRKGKVLINGQFALVVGNVCMDMVMVDVTAIPNVQRGDEVIITSPEYTIQEIAEQAGTIPYVLLTNISQRIKRVYYYE